MTGVVAAEAPIVDAHCHVGREWFEPVEVLLAHMDRAGVSAGILTLPVFAADDSYQRECVARFPERFRNVVSVPPAPGQNPVERIEELARRGISGLRIRSSDRYPGDPLAVWRAAERLDLTVSCFGSTDDLASPAFARILEAVPDVRVVIEHLGSMSFDCRDSQEQRRPVFALAAHPNVFMKIHGIAEFAPRSADPFTSWPFRLPLPPFLDWALERFGPDRLLWGSDFPNVCAREGYANSLAYPKRHLSGLSEADSAKVFGANALRLFPAVVGAAATS